MLARASFSGRIAPLMLMLSACGGSVIQTVPVRFDDGAAVAIDGLTPCTTQSRDVAELDPKQPLVVLVHGCNDSAARFATLSEVFEAHGQQAMCFTYESRETIDVGARRLARALGQIEAQAPDQAITVIGHSQGGLLSRRALTKALDGEGALRSEYELVTVSSPFAGIHVARHCSLNWLHGISFGITVAICATVAGRNWHEIHARSELVEDPGAFRGAVTHYLQIRTDETNSCRTWRKNGTCKRDDFVFSLREQQNRKTQGPSFRSRVVEAGHREIVGEGGDVPFQLIEVLQAEGVMNPTPRDRREAMVQWLDELYSDPPPMPTQRHAARPSSRKAR